MTRRTIEESTTSSDGTRRNVRIRNGLDAAISDFRGYCDCGRYRRWTFRVPTLHRTDSPSGTDGQSLAQIQEQLTSIQKRLGDLETRSKTASARTSLNAKTQEEIASNQSAAPRPPRPQYQVSPEYALPPQPAAARPSSPDPVSAQKIASLQQGIGTLQQETESNRQAWQATTDRLADVAGELGAQHGQILQNQDELHEFLGRAEHTSVTFELRRSSTAESVGPVRISLKAIRN